MGVNKVVINDVVELDLSSDTVATDNLLSGFKAHGKNGEIVNGGVVIQKYYTGKAVPSASLGNDGDIYLMTT